MLTLILGMLCRTATMIPVFFVVAAVGTTEGSSSSTSRAPRETPVDTTEHTTTRGSSSSVSSVIRELDEDLRTPLTNIGSSSSSTSRELQNAEVTSARLETERNGNDGNRNRCLCLFQIFGNIGRNRVAQTTAYQQELQETLEQNAATRRTDSESIRIAQLKKELANLQKKQDCSSQTEPLIDDIKTQLTKQDEEKSTTVITYTDPNRPQKTITTYKDTTRLPKIDGINLDPARVYNDKMDTKTAQKFVINERIKAYYEKIPKQKKAK